MRVKLAAAIVLCAMLALSLAPTTTAQPKTGEIVLSNAGGFHGNALIAMGRYGGITTILPLPAGNVGGVAPNGMGNEDLVVIDKMIMGVRDGHVRTIVGSLSQPARDIDVDEDNTYVMAAGTAVLGVNPVASTRTTITTGFTNASSIAWNGTNGSLMVVDGDKIWAIDRSHNKKLVATVPGACCMTWDSYTGNMFLAAKNYLYALAPGGALTTLESNKPGLKNPTDLFLRSDRVLIVVQGNTSPTGVYAYNGKTGKYNRPYHEDTSAKTGINPMGVTVEHYRELWLVKTTVKIGHAVDFLVNFPLYKGKTYVAALSYSHSPGFPVGNYRLHLNLDPLFMVSLTNPALFKNTGILSTHGTARVTLFVPDIAALAGFRIYMGAVILDPAGKNGFGEATNGLGLTFQPK